MRRVLLLGFMASGKSTVGRLLARRLGWDFLDFDHEVERRTGTTIPSIFQERGEEAFRVLEGQVGEQALTRDRVVLAAGGGWPVAPGRLEKVPAGTLTVWLRVDVDTALARAAAEPGTRPLLQEDGVQAGAGALLARRRPWYARAHLHLDSTGASPDTLVEAIVAAVRGGPASGTS